MLREALLPKDRDPSDAKSESKDQVVVQLEPTFEKLLTLPLDTWYDMLSYLDLEALTIFANQPILRTLVRQYIPIAENRDKLLALGAVKGVQPVHEFIARHCQSIWRETKDEVIKQNETSSRRKASLAQLFAVFILGLLAWQAIYPFFDSKLLPERNRYNKAKDRASDIIKNLDGRCDLFPSPADRDDFFNNNDGCHCVDYPPTVCCDGDYVHCTYDSLVYDRDYNDEYSECNWVMLRCSAAIAFFGAN